MIVLILVISLSPLSSAAAKLPLAHLSDENTWRKTFDIWSYGVWKFVHRGERKKSVIQQPTRNHQIPFLNARLCCLLANSHFEVIEWLLKEQQDYICCISSVLHSVHVCKSGSAFLHRIQEVAATFRRDAFSWRHELAPYRRRVGLVFVAMLVVGGAQVNSVCR